MRPSNRKVALRLCVEIQQENLNRWWSAEKAQCWACLVNAWADPDKMLLAGPKGCNLVNARYQAQLDAEWEKAA